MTLRPEVEAPDQSDHMTLDSRIIQLAGEHTADAVRLLEEAIRIPADFVNRPPADGGDPDCGTSNHEGPRLEYLRREIIELGAVDAPADVGYDEFGNLVWSVHDPGDGIPPAEKTVVYLDGHTDTVAALRPRWLEAIGGGIDAYDGLVDRARIDHEFLRRELGHLPPSAAWRHLVWGRGAADQLGGVVCQLIATRIMRELRELGALRGVIVRSMATVAEEENDGGGAMYLMRDVLPGTGADHVPDAVILTEGTGCARDGALGIYRGQRGRMQIEVEVTGTSCHGSMPWEGRNPLEYGGAMLAEAADLHARGVGFGDDPFLGPGSRTASLASLVTPSDCAVPERFTFRLDRRLTLGETPAQALADVEAMATVGRARAAGLRVDVRVPDYDRPTWRGYRPSNPQIYAGWTTPAEHPAIECAVEAYRRVVTPQVEAILAGGEASPAEETGGDQLHLRREPRVARWVFSTDGVGYPLPADDDSIAVPAAKHWVASGAFKHPAMFGFGPGIEQNTHKIGECVDARELAPVVAMLARFPSLYRATQGR
jgi:acetylornithine deacetylase/succinyl-diaminopimelate desuccinylase-like protein